jgi:hypothetical protein
LNTGSGLHENSGQITYQDFFRFFRFFRSLNNASGRHTMSQIPRYLQIARSFTPSKQEQSGEPVTCEKSEKSEKSPPQAQVQEYLAEREAIGRALGIQEDAPGDYDHKATVAGGVPPLQAILARQEWLASLDWRYGLRCGFTGQQCRHCKGAPCQGSTEWQQN